VKGRTGSSLRISFTEERKSGAVVAQDDSRLDTGYITYPGETGGIRAYSARPLGEEELLGVIVIHENTGLQPHIEDVVRRIALEGFHAIAPDALSPVGGTPASTSQATSLLNQLNTQSTIRNFVAAVQYLKTQPQSTGKVGCTGFCWGGAMTNQVTVNAPDLRAAVPFYGSQPAADVPKIKASLLCHYGALDTGINAGIVAFEAALRAASIDHGIYIHRGAAHAFFNDSRPDRYHKEAADLAWRLTIAFFQAKLRDERLVAHYRLDAPGQTVVAQAGGTNWLSTDAGGRLMTGLSRPAGGRQPASPLVSESRIVDGDWHRIGVVWNGAARALYVDDVLVAEDFQPSIAGSPGRLNIGGGANLESGAFFSGLIDDVRIYNQAVHP
jgi:carboxymethylenebutenolidase